MEFYVNLFQYIVIFIGLNSLNKSALINIITFTEHINSNKKILIEIGVFIEKNILVNRS